MPEFFKIVTAQEALQRLDKYLQPLVGMTEVKIQQAAGRVTARAIYAAADLPGFRRSTMDGFAIRAADSYGATEGLPAYFNIIGEVPMGALTREYPRTGQALKIHTGGMLPQSTDAVVMIENTQAVGPSVIEVVKPAAPGENVLQIGDDIHQGELLLPAGHLIRPQDAGGLAAQGIGTVPVFSQPRVSLITTGDELVPIEKEPQAGQIRDINSHTMAALTRQYGGLVQCRGIAADNFAQLKEAAESAFKECEVLVISAGSSVSTRDMTAAVVASLGNPGILVHGVAIRPGKPVIIAVADNKPVFGLPGNPVSTMVTFSLFVRPAIYRVGGCSQPPDLISDRARLTRNIPSTTGREDYVPVKLERKNCELVATPIFGESNLINTLIRADGMAVVPLDLHGLKEGDWVEIRQF
jgi:molybdopterin molybdotransferase